MQQNSTFNPEAEAPPRLVEIIDRLIRPSGTGGFLLSLILTAALLAAVLLTPPISLAGRLSELGYEQIGSNGGTIRQPDATELVIPAGSLSTNTPLKMAIIPLADFASKAPAELKPATSIPPRLTLKSAVYTFDTRGRAVHDARLSMLIPTDVRDDELTTVDLYAWDGNAWQWQPTTVVPDEDQIYTTLSMLPKAVALFAVAAPRATVGAMMTGAGTLADDSVDVLTEVTLSGLWVDADGSIRGAVEDIPATKGARYLALPTISNLVGEQWDGDLIANIIQNTTLRRNLLNNIAAVADRGLYAGVNIDFRRLPATASDRANFISFVRDLANELRNRRKALMLTLEAPVRVSDDPRPEFAWNMGGYDWVELGRAADTVRIIVPAEAGDELVSLYRVLAFATTQVNRQKVQPVISVTSSVVSSKGLLSLSYDDALKIASAIEVVEPTKPVVAGESTVTVRYTYLTIGDTKTPFYWDPKARQYRFAFVDGAGTGTVWLQDAASVSHKLDALARYTVKGVVLRDPTTERMDPTVWTLLRTYAGSGRVPVFDPAGDSLNLNWQASGGEIVASSSTEITWKAPKDAGRYTVSAALPTAVTSRGAASVSIDVVAPTPTPAPTPSGRAAVTPTPAPVAIASTETPKPIGTMYVSADGDGVYIRSEPDREAKVRVWPDGTAMAVLEELPDWYKVQAPDGYVGYIPAEWLADSPPPTPTPRPAVAAAPVVSSPAVGKYGFDYGIQAHMIQNDHGPIINAVAGMGFRWIKQQVEWIVYEPQKGAYSWGELDRVVNSANAAGIKLLFSVLRSPKWANSEPDGPPRNFNDLGDFLAAMAARYKGRVHAYEVWNEQNLAREWRGHELSAARYVELLRIAYQRIKEQDPDAVVVAGALTPTGVNDPAVGIDDRLYLRQMYQAGLRTVCDAVGVHPSGFANPPDSSWPNNLSLAPSHNNHPSFYFRNTMEDYHNIMVEFGDGRKQLWPTEFGWAVSATPHPGYEYAAYNTEATRAQWLVRAYQMAKAWGFVGPMFLWNLNFRIVAPGSEQAAFGIMDAGWRPTPAWAALRDMPK